MNHMIPSSMNIRMQIIVNLMPERRMRHCEHDFSNVASKAQACISSAPCQDSAINKWKEKHRDPCAWATPSHQKRHDIYHAHRFAHALLQVTVPKPTETAFWLPSGQHSFRERAMLEGHGCAPAANCCAICLACHSRRRRPDPPPTDWSTRARDSNIDRLMQSS